MDLWSISPGMKESYKLIEEKVIRNALKEMILPALMLSGGGGGAHGRWCLLTKMDRSAVYICRQMAKTLVRSALREE